MQTVTIGLLGCGNVGGGVYRLLRDMEAEIAQRQNLKIVIRKILVKDASDPRYEAIDRKLLTENPAEVVEDPQIQLVAEFMGGEQPAADFMLRALRHRKTVVTANKVALALNWPELQQAAQENGVGLYYEASVCGAIPIIRALNHSLHANRITQILGIVNGTTNYILSRMTDEGEPYETVLKDAQRLGLAEPDPTTDVEGLDAAYKLSILASLAFQTRVPFGDISCEGITRISPMDIACGKELGYVIKLLAIARHTNAGVEARVHPAFIPQDHPLAGISDSFNAVYLKGHACQEMMFQGRGAGDMPTASAVVTDILNAASAQRHPHPAFPNRRDAVTPILEPAEGRFFLRMALQDVPGALMQVSSCLAACGVSIAATLQKPPVSQGWMPLVFITHPVEEMALLTALQALDPRFAQVQSLIRVET